MRRHILSVILLTLTCMSLTGCGPVRSRHPVPIDLVSEAQIPGMPHIRTWGDHVDEHYKQSLIQSAYQEEAYYKAHPELKMPETLDMLLLSGGGENGAFGAGLLNGWTAAGNRPEFKLVTGVSTGALIAPYAFLGPQCDDALKHFYTETTAKQILIPKGLLAILREDSMADTEPLATLIGKEMTQQRLEQIAAEHAKGRRLLIATVNIEAQRPVIWDMGAIASSGHPDALKLFRQVMLASASIPAAFPPQYIKVEANGKQYDEMHVDGGTMSQVFLWGAGFSRSAALQAVGGGRHLRPGRMFVIRNGKFHAEHKPMRALFVDIAGRSVSTLIKTQGIGDMYRLHTLAQREEATFNLAYIPPTFDVKLEEPFESSYMRALYQFGYDQAVNGYPWLHEPPYSGLSKESGAAPPAE